ncbi:MAG: hypothetical protein C4550_07335 [Nitrospiraceae bacterium]|nr:MAG: hypothetical protein C4550_07335 [Nitrospiraceae bacterium]
MRKDKIIISAAAASSAAILIVALIVLTSGHGGLLPAHPTKCYDTVNTQISCVNTNHEESIPVGREWDIYSRFTGIGTEVDCTTDMFFGLMWIKSPDSARRTWHEAQQYIT